MKALFGDGILLGRCHLVRTRTREVIKTFKKTGKYSAQVGTAATAVTKIKDSGHLAAAIGLIKIRRITGLIGLGHSEMNSRTTRPHHGSDSLQADLAAPVQMTTARFIGLRCPTWPQ